MNSVILKLTNDGLIDEQAVYSLSSKEALVAFIMQNYDCNYNTWEHPDIIDGMWQSKKSGNWYWEDDNVIYVAIERK